MIMGKLIYQTSNVPGAWIRLNSIFSRRDWSDHGLNKLKPVMKPSGNSLGPYDIADQLS